MFYISDVKFLILIRGYRCKRILFKLINYLALSFSDYPYKIVGSII